MVSKDLAKEISKQNTERSTCFPFATYDDMYSEKGELKKNYSVFSKIWRDYKETGFAGFENKSIFHS